MRKALVFLVPITLTCISVSFAQGDFRPGFIIKNNGDSVCGFVHYRSAKRINNTTLFKEKRKSKSISYSSLDLNAFGFINDKRYQSKKLPVVNSQVFAEIIVKGKLSLYSFYGTFYAAKDTILQLPLRNYIYIQKQDGTYRKFDNRYIGVLNRLIGDCGGLNANKINYSEKDLTNLVMSYNRCNGGTPGLMYKEKKPWMTVFVQAFAGIDVSSFKLAGFDANTFKASQTPFVGVSIDFSAPRTFDRTLVTLEFSYLTRQYEGYTQTNLSHMPIDRRNYLLSISSVRIPLGIRFNLFNETQTPYFKVGLVEYFKTNSTLDIISERENYGTVTTGIKKLKFDDKSEVGFWLSAGYSKSIHSKLKGFVEVRGEVAKGFTGDAGTDFSYALSTSANVAVMAGLRF